MEQIRVIGLDIAKSVFQVHGVDGEGEVVVRRRLKRSRVVPFFASIEPCRIPSRRRTLHSGAQLRRSNGKHRPYHADHHDWRAGHRLLRLKPLAA